MKIYLASGWFDEKQKEGMEQVNEVLVQFCNEYCNESIKLFRPFYDGIVLKPTDSRNKWKETFDLDIKELVSSDLIVASTFGNKIDMGTIFEVGYAHAVPVPSLLYVPPYVEGLNLMLAQSAIGFAKNQRDLYRCLSAFHRNWAKGQPWEQVSTWGGKPI